MQKPLCMRGTPLFNIKGITFYFEHEILQELPKILKFKVVLHLKILKKSNSFIQFFDYVCYFKLKKL